MPSYPYIFDLHEDISDSILYTAHGNFWRENGLHEGWNNLNLPVNNQTDYMRLTSANVRAVFAATCAFDVAEGRIVPCKDHFQESMRHITLYHELQSAKPQEIQIIRTKQDMMRLPDFRLSFLLAMEGADSIDDELQVIARWHELGIRSIGFTWNYRNRVAGGCVEGGHLQEVGKRAISQMEDMGIVLDLAHIHPDSFWDCLAVAKKPVIISHTGCRHYFDHARNVDDDQLRAVANTGGVTGIFGVPKYIGEPINLAQIVKHFLHCIEVAGIDHVSIGSDFGSMTSVQLVPQFEHVPDFSYFIAALRTQGLTEADIEKICHRNIERVLMQTLPD